MRISKISVYFHMTAIFGAVFFIILCSIYSTTAQTLPPFKPKLPEALSKDAPLSPNNVNNYKAIVQKYAEAACLPLKEGEAAKVPSAELIDLRDKLKKQTDVLRSNLTDQQDRAKDLQVQIDKLDYQVRALIQLEEAQGQLDIAITLEQDRLRQAGENDEKLRAASKKKQTPSAKSRVKELQQLKVYYDSLLEKAHRLVDGLKGQVAGLQELAPDKDQKPAAEQLNNVQEQLTEARGRLDETAKQIAKLKSQIPTGRETTDPLIAEGCNPTEATRLRNDLIFLVVGQADNVFINTRAKRRGWTDILDTLMDFLQIGLTTSATLTNGARDKSVLSSLSTLIQGTHSVLQKDFKLKENQIYFNTMETNRAKVFNEILEHMKEPNSSYSFPMALLDVMRYSKAGTLDDAMTKLAASTGNQNQQEEAKLISSKDAFIKKVATKEDEVRAVGARDTLVKLLEQLDSKNPETAAAAKNKLIAIAGQISVDDAVKKEVAANAEQTGLFGELAAMLKVENVDGKALAQKIQDIRESGFGNNTLTQSTLDKIDTIINKADTK